LELTQDKQEAYLTLYEILLGVAKLIAPFAPYLAEEVFRNLKAGLSVHLCDYPEADLAQVDKKLEEEMRLIIDIVGLGRAARNACQIKIRQPLKTMFVPARTKDTVLRMFDLIQEEVNIHEINFVEDDDDFVSFELKADFKVMGPKYGKLMKPISSALSKLKGQEVLAVHAKGESYPLEIEGQTIDLIPEDIIAHIIPKEGYVFESLKDIFVALDTKLTDELLREGYARELINKIQFTRKEQDFEIMDRVKVILNADAEIQAAVNDHKSFIMSETLCDELVFSDGDSGVAPLDINGKEVQLQVFKV